VYSLWASAEMLRIKHSVMGIRSHQGGGERWEIAILTVNLGPPENLDLSDVYIVKWEDSLC